MVSSIFYLYPPPKTEMKSLQYDRNSRRQSMTLQVFWQSIWYLLSFYLTWPPYLALQYLWASGKGYNSYGFVLFASTLVPLQGFWNCVVFFRVRTKRTIGNAISSVSGGISRVYHSRNSTHVHNRGSIAESANDQKHNEGVTLNVVASQ